MASPSETLDDVLAAIRACRVCVEHPLGRPLPHEPRPVLHMGTRARILIAGQAPGTKVHGSGLSFNDRSGDRLRDWLGVDRETFYDGDSIAVAAMGFCFPGQDAKGGDLPPRRECARLWHDRLFAARPPFDLVVAVGATSQAYHLKRLGLERFATGGLTERVMRWREIWAASNQTRVLPLPHPSWRNTGWLKRHPWFEAELLPVLRQDVARIVGSAREGREPRQPA